MSAICRICMIKSEELSPLSDKFIKEFLDNIFKCYRLDKSIDTQDLICGECEAKLKAACNFIKTIIFGQRNFSDIVSQEDILNNKDDLKDPLIKYEFQIDTTHEVCKEEINVIDRDVYKSDSEHESERSYKDSQVPKCIKLHSKSVKKVAKILKEDLNETARIKKKPKRKYTRKRQKSVDSDRVYPRKCDHCAYVIEEKQFHYKHYLFVHTGEEYPYKSKQEFVCQFCGIKKTKRAHHIQHELTHGEKTFQCPFCVMKFHNQKQLKRHELRHRGSRFFCDYCGKGFIHRCDLVLHIRTHTGEKPFKCHLCGAGFAHRGNIKIHINSKHAKTAEENKIKKKKTRKTECASNYDEF